MTVKLSPMTGSVRVNAWSAPGSRVVSEARLGSSWLRAKLMAMGVAARHAARSSLSDRRRPLRAAILAGCFKAMRRMRNAGAGRGLHAGGEVAELRISVRCASKAGASSSTTQAVRPRMKTALARLPAPKVRIAPFLVRWPVGRLNLSARAGAAAAGVGAVAAAGLGVGTGFASSVCRLGFRVRLGGRLASWPLPVQAASASLAALMASAIAWPGQLRP